MPVVDPDRITKDLIDVLKIGAPLFVMLHCNHLRELTTSARLAIARFIDNGIPMLSQSVLLRSVNDNPLDLQQLMRAFVELRIKPHYLHMLDLARGTSHFRVPLAEAQDLMKQMRGHLSGLCQPSLMLDIPGGAGKIPVGPAYIRDTRDGQILTDFRGKEHFYHICDHQ